MSAKIDRTKRIGLAYVALADLDALLSAWCDRAVSPRRGAHRR
jgi:hypothetical protein